VSLQLRSALPIKRLADRDSAWPGDGVLATGAFSSLLWVHGPILFRGHLTPLLLCILALPIIGGMLTPEESAYSALIFGLGSYPPLNDVPPTPIALVPFLRICAGGRSAMVVPTATVDLLVPFGSPLGHRSSRRRPAISTRPRRRVSGNRKPGSLD
jgi:hypothetical protein